MITERGEEYLAAVTAYLHGEILSREQQEHLLNLALSICAPYFHQLATQDFECYTRQK